MATSSTSTPQDLSEISALIDRGLVQEATTRIEALVIRLKGDGLLLISPDVRRLIEKLLPKRRKKLMALLDALLTQPVRPIQTTRLSALPRSAEIKPKTELARAQRYGFRLNELRDHHIFQWATYYRDSVSYIFKDLLSDFRSADLWQPELDQTSEVFARHAEEIYQRGYQYVAGGSVSNEVAELKSLNGLQRFLYLIINLYLDSRDNVNNPKEARLIWDITSCLLVGVLRGYGRVRFGSVDGWGLLYQQRRSWVPVLGFVTGADAANFFSEAIKNAPFDGLFDTVLPALIAFDQLANKHRGTDFILPRLSRISIGEPARLDITLNTAQYASSQDAIISCFFEGQLSDGGAIDEAISLRATVVVASLSSKIKLWVESRNIIRVVDVAEVAQDLDNAHNFAEIVRAAVEKHALADASASETSGLARNYAREFPLEDPDTRRMYMVERHSVKQLLDQFEQGTGVHLWCSVRRSGKTTAATNLADMTGRSVVIVQTMDHQPHQPELNIFERRVTEVLRQGKPLSPDFFEKVVQECLLSTAPIHSDTRKFVFVIDEYESLFGLLTAVTKNEPDLRFLVALPLLSQMVGFSTRNLLILMGQRPDAHHILLSQNQLSPLARQHNFPLFEHHSGSIDSEFVQFLRRVLTKELPFGPTFADAVYEETSGHPYLTVNLMVDFCDWLIGNGAIQIDSALDANRFSAFSRDRLSPAALQRSPHYAFFQRMLGEYLSEGGRKQEPWLHAVANILQKIAKQHPKIFSCSIVNYSEMAGSLAVATRMTPNQLLASASMSNFLKMHSGQVTPAIRLMARLAGCAVAEIN
ncbi:MAG: hypothetical protein V4505_23760 [Pseudomonadota bacterium]